MAEPDDNGVSLEIPDKDGHKIPRFAWTCVGWACYGPHFPDCACKAGLHGGLSCGPILNTYSLSLSLSLSLSVSNFLLPPPSL